MKWYKLLLIADSRGAETVLYKEFQGRKLFFKKPIAADSDKKQKPDFFIKTFRLWDSTANSFVKQKVFVRVLSVENQFLTVEVF